MQAIQTRYIGPSEARGSRIRASCDAASLSIPYDHGLNSEARHRQAAEALIAKLGWQKYGPIVGGSLGDGMVFVFRGGE